MSERTGKALIDATRNHDREYRAKSWWELLSTLTLLAASTFVAVEGRPWPIQLLSATVSGLLLVRMFIVFHDFMHGAILRGSLTARAILGTYGILVMTPPRVWRETHNYHHAHTAQLVGSHIGSYAMVTPGIWAKMSPRARLHYRLVRHPLTILFGYFTVFMLGMCTTPFLRAPKKNWQAGLALLINVSLTVGLIHFFGLATFVFGFGLPLFIATAAGSYLFYAQHNFPDVHVQPREAWSYARAALESSSFMEMSPVMHWFTGNIGYHHVHHLNPSIPFYRLPEAMAQIPELQHPARTNLSPREIVRCLKLKMWDPDRNEMVGYPTVE
jgi:omega-6 fatty acid desaturase (delta-12 desaturase)